MSEVNHVLIPLTARSHWNEAIHDIPHSFGHTWDNCYAMSLTTRHPTFLYYFEDKQTKIVCPIAERDFKGYIDIVTPYGFSGFVGNHDYSNFQSYWKEFVLSKGYVCGYIGLNPVFENSTYLDSSNLFEYSHIYVLDLQLDIAQLFANLSTNRKRQLKRHKDQQLTIIHDKSKLRKFFLSNYTAFYNTKQHSKAYDLTYETLSALLETDTVFLNGIQQGNEIKAVSMYAFTPYCADYLFTISFERDHTFPLIWNAIEYLKALNIPKLNLGGGVRKDDSIAEFKERFGGIKLPLCCLKQVYNNTVYEMLNKHAQVTSASDCYFPAYRSSVMIEC